VLRFTKAEFEDRFETVSDYDEFVNRVTTLCGTPVEISPLPEHKAKYLASVCIAGRCDHLKFGRKCPEYGMPTKAGSLSLKEKAKAIDRLSNALDGRGIRIENLDQDCVDSVLRVLDTERVEAEAFRAEYLSQAAAWEKDLVQAQADARKRHAKLEDELVKARAAGHRDALEAAKLKLEPKPGNGPWIDKRDPRLARLMGIEKALGQVEYFLMGSMASIEIHENNANHTVIKAWEGDKSYDKTKAGSRREAVIRNDLFEALVAWGAENPDGAGVNGTQPAPVVTANDQLLNKRQQARIAKGLKGQTAHQFRVERMMRGFGQEVPDRPLPAEGHTDLRVLRARLIMEECLETIQDGLRVEVGQRGQAVRFEHLAFEAKGGGADMIELADGCADVSVVTIGTLSAFGIRDDPLLREVDGNNQAKIDTGRTDEHGKFIKHPDHEPPKIAEVLVAQGWAAPVPRPF
jgi:predicted HAD superfamily Cof-like phosphohydrolase